MLHQNYMILSQITFFFAKFLCIKYYLYASIKILTPNKIYTKGFLE